MSVLSLPSQSFSASPFDLFLARLRHVGKAAWAALVAAPRNEPRTAYEVRAWARSLEPHQPSLAAELNAIASRSDV